jgi:hypothetical protein
MIRFDSYAPRGNIKDRELRLSDVKAMFAEIRERLRL